MGIIVWKPKLFTACLILCPAGIGVLLMVRILLSWVIQFFILRFHAWLLYCSGTYLYSLCKTWKASLQDIVKIAITRILGFKRRAYKSGHIYVYMQTNNCSICWHVSNVLKDTSQTRYFVSVMDHMIISGISDENIWLYCSDGKMLIFISIMAIEIVELWMNGNISLLITSYNLFYMQYEY